MARYTRDQWLAFFSEHKDSGLTATEFCRQKNLNAKYFSLRKHQLLKIPSIKRQPNKTPTKFVAAQITAAVTAPIIVRYQSIEVSLPATLPVHWVADFVKALP